MRACGIDSRSLFLTLLVVWTASIARGETIYVNDNPPTAVDDGQSWATAHFSLQTALARAAGGDEIWVAAGVYRPAAPGGSRNISFRLASGVELYGGFSGDETSRSERDWAMHETILSGDLNNNDVPGEFMNIADNSMNVILAENVDATARLDGFYIEGGNADLSGDGGGILNDEGSPVIENCTLRHNAATTGGGMANVNGSYPRVSHCRFLMNRGSSGGGMTNRDSGPVIRNCNFQENFTLNLSNRGGAIYNARSTPQITDCVFEQNLCHPSPGSAKSEGGAIYAVSGALLLINCSLVDNTADDGGGGIHNVDNALSLIGCTFRGNSVVGNDGFGGAMTVVLSSPIRLEECLFEGNFASRSGGAMRSGSIDAEVKNCRFVHNSCNQTGGAIYDTGVTSNLRFVNCGFHGNSAGGAAGAIWSTSASIAMTNSTLSGNTAVGDGGGLWVGDSNPVLTNCTLSNNRSGDDGGGIYAPTTAVPILHNSILWQNEDAGGQDESAQVHSLVGGGALVEYSCIQGWTGTLGGNGNVGDDPLFMDVDGADGVLGTADDDLRLSPESAAIDAASNALVPPDALDLDGDGDTNELTPLDRVFSPRFVDDSATADTGTGLGAIVDMGAYEAQDCNSNGILDVEDIAAGTSDDANRDGIPDECQSPIALCATGSIGRACGPNENVLFVNGMTGGRSRKVSVGASTPLSISIQEPTSMQDDGRDTSLCVYIWPGQPTASDRVIMPKGLGEMCFGPRALATRMPKRTWNSIGFTSELGEHDAPGAPPLIPDRSIRSLLTVAEGVGRPLRVTVQGLVEDTCSAANVPFSVTNAVVLEVE